MEKERLSLEEQKRSAESLIRSNILCACNSLIDLIESTDGFSEHCTAMSLIDGEELSLKAPDLADKDKVTIAYLELRYLCKRREEVNLIFDHSDSEPSNNLSCWIKKEKV